jgi:WD40 repeat protein
LIFLWDVAQRQVIEKPLRGHTSGVVSLAFGNDNTSLISGGNDNVVIRWKIKAKTKVGYDLVENSNTINSVVIGSDGKTLAAGDQWDGSVQFWDLETNSPLTPPLPGHTARIRDLAFSPDGRLLASAGDDKVIIVWDVASRQELAHLHGHSDQVMSVAFSPDSKVLASGSKDKRIILWDMNSFQPILTLTGHQSWIMGVAFSPDGLSLASGGWDQSVRLWNIATGEDVPLIRENLDLVSAVAFSPDGELLASGGHPGDIYLWDVQARLPSGELLTGHRAGINRLVFSSDGNYMASASKDGDIIIWNMVKRELHMRISLNSQGVNSVTFSPNGKILAAGSCDRVNANGLCIGGRILVLDLNPESWQLSACLTAGRNLTQAEWRLYLPNEEYHTTCPEWPVGK